MCVCGVSGVREGSECVWCEGGKGVSVCVWCEGVCVDEWACYAWFIYMYV